MSALREGFTTGSCAAACALASALWQLGGECPERVEILTPAGKIYAPAVFPRGNFMCAVIKDSGDDPDVTNGHEICARTELSDEDGPICFRAGEGVGTITLPGLKLPVGEAAINPVPRKMIETALRNVIGKRAAVVTVSIPDGRKLAQRTFNPRLGVEGGLSILGTTGIVRPMSDDAIMDTIALEMGQKSVLGARRLALVFGSQGENALAYLGINIPCVQISNFVGFALDTAEQLKMNGILLAGQPGKLVKVAGGCMNTHSRYGDGRRETLTAHLALMGAPLSLLKQTMESVTLDGMIAPVREAGYAAVWSELCRAAERYCEARMHDSCRVKALMLDAGGKIIGGSMEGFEE